MTSQQTPPPYYPAAPAPQPKNGLGTTSLIMGILSLVLAWAPFVGFVTYITSLVGIVTGALGRGRVKKGVATNGGAAMGGLITSILGLLSVILATVVYSSVMYAVASSAPTDLPSSVPSKSAATNDAKDEASSGPTDEPAAGIGDTVTDGEFAFTVEKVTTASSLGGELGEEAQGKFVIVHVTAKNTGNSAEMFEASNQTLFDTKSREFTTSSAQLFLESDAFLEDINPGNKVNGKLVFDMPKSAKADSIELHAGALGISEGATVDLR